MSSNPRRPVVGEPSLVPTLATAVRARRERAGLSQAELARMAKVSPGTLSALEAGSGNPTIGTLWALARVLGCEVADLLTEGPDPLVTFVAADQGVWVRGGAYDARLIHRFAPNGPVELYEGRLGAGQRRSSEPHEDGVYEHLWIVDGDIVAGPEDAPRSLGSGDYMCFQGWQPHVYHAGPKGARILIAMTYMRSLWAQRRILGHGEFE